MPKFFSSFNRPPSIAHPPCPTEQQDYIKDVATGELVPCGTIPFYERIQSYHESTTLAAKLKRFALGDSTALGTPNNNFGDFTNMPTDLRQILDSRKKINQDFANLPDDVRAIFNDDFEQFEKSVKDGTAERRIVERLKSNVGAGGSQASTGDGSNTGGNQG